MKLRLVKGAWVRIDGLVVRRFKVGGSSSFEPCTTTNETLELLRNLHLKQYQHYKFLKGYIKEHE